MRCELTFYVACKLILFLNPGPLRIPYEICAGASGTVTVLLLLSLPPLSLSLSTHTHTHTPRVHRLCSVSIILPVLHIHLHSETTVRRRTSGRSLRTFKQRSVVSDIGEAFEGGGELKMIPGVNSSQCPWPDVGSYLVSFRKSSVLVVIGHVSFRMEGAVFRSDRTCAVRDKPLNV